MVFSSTSNGTAMVPGATTVMRWHGAYGLTCPAHCFEPTLRPGLLLVQGRTCILKDMNGKECDRISAIARGRVSCNFPLTDGRCIATRGAVRRGGQPGPQHLVQRRRVGYAQVRRNHFRRVQVCRGGSCGCGALADAVRGYADIVYSFWIGYNATDPRCGVARPVRIRQVLPRRGRHSEPDRGRRRCGRACGYV